MGLRHKVNPYILLKKLDFDDSKGIKPTAQQVSKESDLVNRKMAGEALSVGDSDAEVEIEHIHVQTLSGRNCVHCELKGIKAFTHWKCEGCSLYLCNQNSGISCFQKVHSEHILIYDSRRSGCYYCKMRTTNRCPICNKFFCNVGKRGRDCFNSYHAARAGTAIEKLAEVEMSSAKMIKNSGHSSSNSTDALQVLDEVSPLPYKTPDFKVLSKVPPSPDSKYTSASAHQASWGKNHFLISDYYRTQCCYCQMRIKSKCQGCNQHLCHPGRTGRDCFNLYHAAHAGKAIEKLAGMESVPYQKALRGMAKKKIPVVEIISDKMDDDDSDGIVSNHTPVFVEDIKVCFYCKAEGSYWYCPTCGKSLCFQKTGETCFRAFHSSLRKAKRPNKKRILQAYSKKSR